MTASNPHTQIKHKANAQFMDNNCVFERVNKYEIFACLQTAISLPAKPIFEIIPQIKTFYVLYKYIKSAYFKNVGNLRKNMFVSLI
jgi:hypothetical protein